MRIPSSSRSPDHDPHRTIYYLGYPLGRFAGLKHRQLARQVGVIITIGRIRRTLINKINLLVNSPRSIEASHLSPFKAESIFLRRSSSCFGTSRGSSSTTSTRPCVRVPRYVTRLVTQLVAPLVVDYAASRRLVVDYFAYAARPGASARRRLLRLRRASGCLGRRAPRVRVPRPSCGSSRGSSLFLSSTTPPNRATHSSAPLLPSPEYERRGRASTALPLPLTGDITGPATTPNRARVRLIAARCRLLPSSGAPSPAASSPAPPASRCIGLSLVGFFVLNARVDW
jgi:hypothetical protein